MSEGAVAIGEVIVLVCMSLGAGLIAGVWVGLAVRFKPIARAIRVQAEIAAANAKCGAELQQTAERNAEVARVNAELGADLVRRYAVVVNLEKQFGIQPEDSCETN